MSLEGQQIDRYRIVRLLGLTQVGFLGKARGEGARGRRARRATIKALPTHPNRPRPYGLTSSFPINLPV